MRVTGVKNLEKREVRSHNKVRALFAENKVLFCTCGTTVILTLNGSRFPRTWHLVLHGPAKPAICR